MANIISGKTWFLDTVGSITTERVKIKEIHWTGILTDADDLLINESAGGQVVVKAVGFAKSDMSFLIDGWRDGLYLTTLDSGSVMVTIE